MGQWLRSLLNPASAIYLYGLLIEAREPPAEPYNHAGRSYKTDSRKHFQTTRQCTESACRIFCCAIVTSTRTLFFITAKDLAQFRGLAPQSDDIALVYIDLPK